MRLVAAAVTLAACGSDPLPLHLEGPGTPVTAAPALAGQATFTAPVPHPEQISSTFGPRWKTSASRYDFHPGIDFYDALGTPVTAIGPGVVDGVYPDGSSTFPLGGNVLVIRHELSPAETFHGQSVDHFFAVYLHLQSFAVAEGDTVTAGQTVGAMGMTGDTEFVHLHFETRVQTVCSLPYQLAHPDSSCALGFDPHVHPFLFLGGASADRITITETADNTYRYVATRDDLDLDMIVTDRGTVGFSSREGLDASSLDTLDNFDLGWLTIVPEPFSSDSTEIAYQLQFAAPISRLEIRDIHGHGLRF